MLVVRARALWILPSDTRVEPPADRHSFSDDPVLRSFDHGKAGPGCGHGTGMT
jgi:hypothetical protein